MSTGKEKDTVKAFNARVPKSKLDKIAYIAWHDRKSQTAVFLQAIDDAVKKWETKNGAITEDMIKQSQR